MARYVQDAKNILGEISPRFMELDAIRTPPIDFADALVRARRTTASEIERLALHGPPEGDGARKVVRQNVRVTFTYLLLQLHIRGPSDFWASVDGDQLFCYLAFRTVDQYADVLTHVNVDGFDCRQVLEDLVSADRLGGLRQEFNQLLALLQRQRRQHRAEVGWRPSDVDVQLLMREHADIILVRHLKELSIKVLAGLAVAGVAYYAISRRIWARRP